MNKTLKIITTVLMVIFTVASFSQVVLAADSATSIIDNISADTSSVDATKLQSLANNVLGLIQIVSAVAAVILIAVFGLKFILGSANEKADYQKSFIPLIVGVVVVFAASSIAKLLFSTFANLG